MQLLSADRLLPPLLLQVSGFPVVDGQQRLIGVLSKRDLNKGGVSGALMVHILIVGTWASARVDSSDGALGGRMAARRVLADAVQTLIVHVLDRPCLHTPTWLLLLMRTPRLSLSCRAPTTYLVPSWTLLVCWVVYTLRLSPKL